MSRPTSKDAKTAAAPKRARPAATDSKNQTTGRAKGSNVKQPTMQSNRPESQAQPTPRRKRRSKSFSDAKQSAAAAAASDEDGGENDGDDVDGATEDDGVGDDADGDGDDVDGATEDEDTGAASVPVIQSKAEPTDKKRRQSRAEIRKIKQDEYFAFV
jgi:hypothetical protein